MTVKDKHRNVLTKTSKHLALFVYSLLLGNAHPAESGRSNCQWLVEHLYVDANIQTLWKSAIIIDWRFLLHCFDGDSDLCKSLLLFQEVTIRRQFNRYCSMKGEKAADNMVV